MNGELFLPAALAMGLLVPVQTAANARLREAAGAVSAATLLSFTVSLLFLLAADFAAGLAVLPPPAVRAETSWWMWTGGVLALLTISAVTALFRELGQLQTVVLPLAGQILWSLVIDHFGLFGAARIPLSPVRAGAALLLLAGVFLAVRAGDGSGLRPGRRAVPWQALAVVSGGLMASVGAIYGTLGRLLGSAVQASALSFLAAVPVMAAVCAARGTLPLVRRAFAVRRPWWMWLGGFVGAGSVFGNAWLIPVLGAGAFFMAFLFGQILLGLCMESRGWLGAARRPVSRRQLCGAAVMLAAVVLLRL